MTHIKNHRTEKTIEIGKEVKNLKFRLTGKAESVVKISKEQARISISLPALLMSHGCPVAA
jgi:hypothetical protein